jgi:hypothetical protein
MTSSDFLRLFPLRTGLLCALLIINTAYSRHVLNFTSPISSGLSFPAEVVNAGLETSRPFTVECDGIVKVYDASFNVLGNFLTILSFTAKPETGYNELRWKTIRDINLQEFAIEYSTDGINWTKAGTVAPQDNNVSPEYVFKHPTDIEGTIFYRLRMIDKQGPQIYSTTISINTNTVKGPALQLFPAVNSYGPLQVQVNEQFANLQVFNINGQPMLTQNLQNQTGIIRLNVSGFSKGMYIVVVSRPDKKVSKTFMVQ